VKQSLRSRLPALETVASLAAALAVAHAGERLVADPAGPAALPGFPATSQLTITLAVGPPGGFDDGEGAELRAASFTPISLGPNRLTTETASIALLSAVRNSIVSRGLAPI
jgi:16S rRNA (uracil1498-N3)-methyltransferase